MSDDAWLCPPPPGPLIGLTLMLANTRTKTEQNKKPRSHPTAMIQYMENRLDPPPDDLGMVSVSTRTCTEGGRGNVQQPQNQPVVATPEADEKEIAMTRLTMTGLPRLCRQSYVSSI